MLELRFEDVDNALSSLRNGMPDLAQQIDGLGKQMLSARLAIDSTITQIAEWQGVVARPTGWSVDEDDDETDQPKGQSPIQLPEFTRQVALLGDQVERSRRSLGQLNGLFDQNVGHTNLDGRALRDMVGAAQTVERQLGELITRVFAELEGAQLKIEQVAGDVVRGASEVLQQSQEALERGAPFVRHGAILQRDQAGRTREKDPAALVARTTAMRVALDQARADLIGRWDNADQHEMEDYNGLLADFGRYAESLARGCAGVPGRDSSNRPQSARQSAW